MKICSKVNLAARLCVKLLTPAQVGAQLSSWAVCCADARDLETEKLLKQKSSATVTRGRVVAGISANRFSRYPLPALVLRILCPLSGSTFKDPEAVLKY